jgi:hypothetical protein
MSKQKGVSFIYLLHTNHEIIGKPQNTSLTKTRNTHDNTSLLATLTQRFPYVTIDLI